jgi:hypothetical protein
MNAVISGQAGIALLLDGAELSSVHAHSLEEVVRRRSRDVPYLLGDAQDLQFIEDVGIEEVSSRLTLATSQMDALHLALILLDSELEVDTRRTAAEELEEELEKPDVARFVESVLYAHPLPREGDLSGARSSCTGRTARVQGMLRNLGRLQPVIASVYFAWEQIPALVFRSEQDRQSALAAAVREGLFRELVLNRADRGSLDAFRTSALRNKSFAQVPNHREVLNNWVRILRAEDAAPAKPKQTFKSRPQFVAEGKEIVDRQAVEEIVKEVQREVGQARLDLIVPLVVDAVTRLIDRLAALGAGEPIREALVAEIVTPADVRRIVDEVDALDAQAQANPLTQALRRSLVAHAESFRARGE